MRCYFSYHIYLFMYSFLDDTRNAHLIRWSEDGESFTIVDEDEFARTMIPELFKHNNYASFVRQLNMYGFHKKVGLADNSMKSSERKSKAPSEYYNVYFKRDKPDLLWLIHKPKPVAGGKQPQPRRRRDDDGPRSAGESDDDERRLSPDSSEMPTERVRHEDQQGSATPRNRSGQGRHAGQGLATLPHMELANLRGEVQRLQRQQQLIINVISQMKKTNEQIFGQAANYQNLHDRHENSINAILTFLATFYNQSLDSHGGQNLANMFTNSIPQHAQQGGNYADVTEVQDMFTAPAVRNVKRPLALLPPPESENAAIIQTLSRSSSRQGSSAAAAAATGPSTPVARPVTARKVSAVRRAGAGVSNAGSASSKPQGRLPATPPIKLEQSSPTVNSGSGSGSGFGSGSWSNSQRNDDVMSAIRTVNAARGSSSSNTSNMDAAGGSVMDFSSALDQFQSANGKTPMTAQERNEALSMIAANQQPSLASQPSSLPDLSQLAASQAQLDMIQQLQMEQSEKVQDLAQRLQPLSPTGSIPGLNGGVGSDAGPSTVAANDMGDVNGYFDSFRGIRAGVDSELGAVADGGLGIIGENTDGEVSSSDQFNFEAYIEPGDYIPNAELARIHAVAGDDSNGSNSFQTEAVEAGLAQALTDPADGNAAAVPDTVITSDENGSFSLSDGVDANANANVNANVNVNNCGELMNHGQHQEEEEQQQQQQFLYENSTLGRVDSLSSLSQSQGRGRSRVSSPAGSGAEASTEDNGDDENAKADANMNEVGTGAAEAGHGAKRRRIR